MSIARGCGKGAEERDRMGRAAAGYMYCCTAVPSFARNEKSERNPSEGSASSWEMPSLAP